MMVAPRMQVRLTLKKAHEANLPTNYGSKLVILVAFKTSLIP